MNARHDVNDPSLHSRDDPAAAGESLRLQKQGSAREIISRIPILGSIMNANQRGIDVSRAGAVNGSSSVRIGADGCLRFPEGTGPGHVVISVEDPFNCQDIIWPALAMLKRDDSHVHILWITDRPAWAGLSFNSGLVHENLRFVRQRGVAALERMTERLEREGYSATWEADESDEPNERVALAARDLDTDLLVIPAPSGIGFFAQRRLNALSDVVRRPILTVGSDHSFQLLNDFDSRSTSLDRSTRRNVPRTRGAEKQRRSSRERLSARGLDT